MQQIVKYYKQILQKLQQFIDSLEPREKIILMTLGILFGVIISSYGITKIFLLKSKLSEHVKQLKNQYNYTLRMSNTLNNSDIDVDFSDIDPSQFFLTFNTLLEEHQLVISNIDEINENDRTKYRITLQLRSVAINSVFELLYDLEVSNRIQAQIERLTIKKSLSAEESYDVDMNVRMK